MGGGRRSGVAYHQLGRLRYTFLAPHYNLSTGNIGDAVTAANGTASGTHSAGSGTPLQPLSPVAGRQVHDLFNDMRDGHALISLLEVLSGEPLPRDKGHLRFHMLNNVQYGLDFLRYRQIKLVNIRCEDIVDGNPKLTLGLIWTIILHFQSTPVLVVSYAKFTPPRVVLTPQLTRLRHPRTARDASTRLLTASASPTDTPYSQRLLSCPILYFVL
ncbi:Calponin domain [Trinorchestia longiramus]|nr:Calponin domain [Trinorchestia longiramus]